MTQNLLEVEEGDTVVFKYRPDAIISSGIRGLEEDLHRRGVHLVRVPIVDDSHPVTQIFVVIRGGKTS